MNPIRQALEGDKSVLVDIETFGLGKGDPVHEISILHASKRRAVEIVPQPMGVKSLVPDVDPIRAPVDKRQVQTWDNWTDAFKDYPDSYAEKHKERYPHLRGEKQKPFRKVRYGDDVVRVKHVAGLSAKEALSTTLDLIKNKTVWIANVPFEASRLGLMAEVTKQSDRVSKQATYGGRNAFQSLLVSDPGVLEARIRAHKSGDWTGVYEAMKRVDYDAPGTKVFDIQDLVRATQSYGNKVSKMAGLGLDFSEVYQGTSLNVQARLLGLPPEAHTSVKDNILAQKVGLKMVDHIEALDGMVGKLHGMTGAALNPTSQPQKDALDYIHRMHSYKQKSRESYLDQRLARAHIDIEQNQRAHGVYTGESVYKTTKKHNGQKVPTRVGMPTITDMGGMDEVINHLSSRPEYSQIDVGARYRKMRDGATGDANYYKNFESSASNAADGILDSVMSETPSFKFGQGVVPQGVQPGPRFDARVGRASGHDYLKKMGKRTGIGVGLLALSGIIGATGKISGDAEDYNNIEGMGEDNYSSYLRQGNTDFGSPYQGLWGSVSSQIASSMAGGSTPNYVNGVPINQEISDFRDQQMQTPFQKRLIEAEMTKQSLKSMNRLYFLDPSLTTSVASSDYGLSGHKDLQHIDLSQVDWSVEDADTIIMKQGYRGMMGQEMQIRLAGIDAPEVQHSDEAIDRLRYKQGQPHGEAARDRLKEILTNAKKVEVVSDPSQATYGRGLGVLFADGQNVNLQLVKEGHVAALPFGERSADLVNRDAAMNAERAAAQGRRGMWQNEYWQTYRNSVSEYSRVTFNTLSRKDKLAGNMNLAGLEATMSMAQDEGQSRLTYMSQNALRPKLANLGRKREFKDNTFSINYHTTGNAHLSQLKLETARHMKSYGTSQNMSVSSTHVGNQNVVSDSLSSSHSIYHDELPTIIDKYTRKAGKRKLQAETQREANKFMNTKNRYGGE